MCMSQQILNVVCYKFVSFWIKPTSKVYGIPPYVPSTFEKFNHSRWVDEGSKMIDHEDWDSGEITWRDVITNVTIPPIANRTYPNYRHYRNI